ncbi:MAG: hypothetical protein KIS94_07365 [Chitinophagales bacterium]|nr:hypothetical protein [Chitinophagales bacterium]
MKNVSLLTMAAALCMLFNSCKKCSDCELECRSCTKVGFTPVTVCRNANESITAVTASYTASGYDCTTEVNDNQKVCTSGLFFRLRHDSNVKEKEDAGYKCN